jgi:hypothetical protein
MDNYVSSGDWYQLVYFHCKVLYCYFDPAKLCLSPDIALVVWQGEGENWIPSFLPILSSNIYTISKDLKELKQKDL